MKKRRIIGGIIIALSVILVVSLGIYAVTSVDYTVRYKRVWNLTLPNDMQKLYSAQDPGFTGDGDYYKIFKLKDQNAPFLEQVSQSKNNKMEAEVIKILTGLKVDKQNYPDFSRDYRWGVATRKGGMDIMYIIYDQQSSLVYLVEQII